MRVGTGSDHPDQNTGYLFFAIHGISQEFDDPAYRAAGEITFTFMPPYNNYIKQEQLDAVRLIYETNCLPTQLKMPAFDPSLSVNDVNKQCVACCCASSCALVAHRFFSTNIAVCAGGTAHFTASGRTLSCPR